MAEKSHKKLAKQVNKMRSALSRLMRENPREVLNINQMASRLELRDAVDKQILAAVVESMIKDKLLEEEVHGRFRWAGPVSELEGIILFNRSGNAFVAIEGRKDDVMIPEHHTGMAFHEDRVLVQINTGKPGSRTKGRVTEIVERARTVFACVIFQNQARRPQDVFHYQC